MRKLENPRWQQERERASNLKLLAGITALLVPVLCVGVYFAATSYIGGLEYEGKRIVVNAGGDFQAALGAAKPGDTIVLQAGARYRGPFNLPPKPGNKFITITTSASSELLPKEGERVDPKKHAKLMPKLDSRTTQPVINAENGAHHYRFVGIEFGGTQDGLYNIIQIGTTEEKKVEDLPHHIEFDRVYIHATSPKGQRRGIAANGRSIVIKNSHISGIRRKAEESQAIAVWATDGPVTIENNYLEAAAENILFGGAGSKLRLVPSNCVVRGNTLNKPLEWREEGWLVKNLFEIKNGKNIIVVDNLMTNNWAKGQDGTAILFTVREDNGAASTIEDVVFENNVVKGSGGALNIYGSEGSGGRRLTVRNNLFADIDSGKWGGAGQFMTVTDWDGLTVENNTVIHNGNITKAYGKPILNMVFRNNIMFNNEYGIIGDEVSPGRETLKRYFPSASFSNNVVIGGSRELYGSTNFYVTSVNQIGLRDDFTLAPDSPYNRRGFQGNPIGYQKDASGLSKSRD